MHPNKKCINLGLHQLELESVIFSLISIKHVPKICYVWGGQCTDTFVSNYKFSLKVRGTLSLACK